MSKIPFNKFIVALLLSGKSVPYVVEKLKTFHYHITDPEVTEVFDDLKCILPEVLRDLIITGNKFDIHDGSHVQWLKQLNVHELYDFMHSKYEDPPPYFKWIEDIMWVHSHEDIMSLINIFLYNNESKESISKIISFKYRRKIGLDALILYEMMFWNSANMTSKEAMYHCIPFRSNAVIVKKLRSGNIEIGQYNAETATNGSDVGFLFHDSNYIKWKIGYKDIEVPGAREFFESVKKDSYYKYYESMNMTQSIEVFDEDGSNDKIGAYESHKVSKKNVEEQRVKLAKSWFNMYTKANDSAPEGAEKKRFFDELGQVSLEFNNEDKIMAVEDEQGMLEEIKGDM